jgi:glycosyltransferase involved in cell wall biosynthesis
MTTRRQLACHVRDDARIQLYRPSVQNVFQLETAAESPSKRDGDPLVVGALGTIEPRKNFLAAARICAVLSEVLQRPVHLHIVGRKGWGSDFDQLAGMPHVTLHGFLSDDAARRVIASFDVFLCTSHDEGLGLPLLEMQYAGLPVIAPDQEVFREVLGTSGTFITTREPERAAGAIAALLHRPSWRSSAAERALANVKRWNEAAEHDRVGVVGFLTELRDRIRRWHA